MFFVLRTKNASRNNFSHIERMKAIKEINEKLVEKWVDGREKRADLIEWMIPKVNYKYREVSPQEVENSLEQNNIYLARSSIIPVIKIHDQNFWFLGSFREYFKGERILSDFGGTCKYVKYLRHEEDNKKSSESPLKCALRETREETKGLLNDSIENAIEKGNYTIFEGKGKEKGSTREHVIYFYVVFVDYRDIKDLPTKYLKAKKLVKEKLGPLGFYLQANILNRVHRTARNLTDFVSFLNDYQK